MAEPASPTQHRQHRQQQQQRRRHQRHQQYQPHPDDDDDDDSDSDSDSISISISDSDSNSDNDNDNDNDDLVPPLNCLSAAIFVPIDIDINGRPQPTTLLTPLPPFPTREDRQRAALALINAHEAHVRKNLQALFRHELLRLTRDGEAQEVAYEAQKAEFGAGGVENHSALVDHAQRLDVAGMVANMATPHDPAVDYNNVSIPLPSFVDPVSSPREWTSNELMKVISMATTNLCGFDKQVASMRDAVLKKDEEREAA